MVKHRRRSIRKTILVCIFLVFVCSAFVSEAGEFHAEYYASRLDNGVNIVCNYMPDSSLVTIEVRVLSGLSNEDKYAGSGISHFLEHLLFKGTNSKGADELQKSIKAMGGMVNASTGKDSAVYYITVPKGNFEKALNLLSDMVMNATFTDREMELERDVILKEIKLYNDDPTSRRINLLFENAYEYHIYKNSVIGSEGKLKNLSKEDIIKYHNAVYVPDRIVVGIAGGVPPDEAITFAEKQFEKYAKKNVPWEREVFKEPEQVTEKKKVFPAEVTLGYMTIGFHMTSMYSPQLYSGDVLSVLLGGGNDSRLYKRLVKEKKLLYSVESQNYTPEFPGLFIITGIGEPEKLVCARDEIFKVIEELKAESITNEEITRAKNLIVSGYIYSHEQTKVVVSSITSSQVFMGIPDFFEKYVEEIKKVDSKEIKNVLLEYLKKDNSTTIFLMPEKYIETEFLDWTREEGNKDVSDIVLEEVKKSDSPRRQSGDVRREDYKISEKKVETIDQQELIVLDNGLKIIAQRKGYLPIVSVTFAVQAGVRAEVLKKSGISNLMASLLLKGTTSRDEKDIVPVIEALGGSIAPFSGMDSAGVSMNLLSKDLTLGLDVFQDVVKNAAFPEEEIVKQKEKITALIREQDMDIFENGIINLRELIYGNHPYAMRLQGEVETVNAISRADIKDFYEKYFVPDGAVLTVVGDVDIKKTMEFLKTKFEAWQGGKTFLPEREVLPLKKSREKNIYMLKEQALFLMGFRGARKTDKMKYILDVTGALLSGTDGLLFKYLRRQKGLAYALGAVSVPEEDPGYFVLYAATTENNLEKSRKGIVDIIKRVKSGDVSRVDIDACRESLISQWAYAVETNEAVSKIMALDELYGLGFQNY
ncbi:MAG: insulinase family protein, partial [Candidatus Omnitrophica bacterium]|nr:insulinase family protein [Candidatus Omnitrophota bacterium]